MATKVTKPVVKDGRDGGFYKCEECSKSFNRMASYEAHIRMHAQEELDVLDLVFNYSQKMHEGSGEQRRRSMNGRTQRRRFSARLSASPVAKLDCVAGKPSTSVVSEGTAIGVVDRAVNGCDADSNAVSSTTAPSLSPSYAASVRSGVGVSQVARINSIPSQMVTSDKSSSGNELPLKIPLRYCSGSLMRGPTINLTKQSSDSQNLRLLLQSRPPQSVEKALSDGSLETDSTDREGEDQESITNDSILTGDKNLPQSRVVRLDSLGLPQESDDRDKSTSPTETQSRFRKHRMIPLTDRYRCHECGRCLASNASLKRHQLLHTGERPFKCSMCPRTFTQPHHRLNHELTHWAIIQRKNDTPPVTEPTPTESSPPQDKEESMSTDSPPEGNKVLKKYKVCKVCKKVYKNISSLREHIMTHDIRRKYQCPVCPKKFAQPAHCALHLQVHSHLTHFSCPECHKEFTDFKVFEDHLRSHRYNKPVSKPKMYKYDCKYCPKVCRSISGLKRHLYIHQLPPNSSCETYDRELQEELAAIKNRMKKIQEKSFNESAFLSSELDLELDSDSSDPEDEIDTGSGDVGCGVVGGQELPTEGISTGNTIENGFDERERSEEMLNEEEREGSSDEENTMSPLRLETDEESSDHEGNQEQVEKKVNTSYNNDKKMRRMTGMHYRNPHNHMKARTNKVPEYKCEWCGRMFLRRNYLLGHYALHRQVPHPCNLCDKVFMSRMYLKRHLRTAHSNKTH